MIRVTKSEERERTIITLEGQLSADYVEAVEICCNQAVSKGKPIDVFLHDVLTIDKSGRALLARLAAQGIRLLATGIYTSYIVRSLMPIGIPGPVSPSAAAGAVGGRTDPKFEGNHR
jgi:ABC-type transporter Mla MlaB component